MEPVKLSEIPLRISTWRLKCAVSDCNSKKSENSLISLHKLPAPNKQSVYITDYFGNKKEIDRLEAWKSALKLETISNTSRVCSLHFTKEDYHYYLPDMPAAVRKLKQYAVPSCNLPGRKFNKEKFNKRRARHEKIIATDKNKESMKKRKDLMKFHISQASDEFGEPVSCFTDAIKEANMSIRVNETVNVPTDLLTELQLTETFSSLPVELQEVVISEKSDFEINQCEDCEPIEPVSENVFQNSDLETQELFFQPVRIPSDSMKQNEWIQKFNSIGWAPNENDRICSRHFEERFFRRSGSKVGLLNQAVPTIFPSYPFNLQQKEVYKRSRSAGIRSGSPGPNEPGTSGMIQENAPDSPRKKKLKSEDSVDMAPQKKVRRNCMVLFCKNKYSTPEITFFSLTYKRHDSWMRALGRDPSKEILRQSNVVCSEHFLKEDIEVSGNKKKLREGVVPKLNLGLKNPHILLSWKKSDYSCKVPYESNMGMEANMVEETGFESELVVDIKTESEDLCMDSMKIERDDDVENKLEIVSKAIKEEPDDYIDNGENYMYDVKCKNEIVEQEIKAEITSADEDNSPEIKIEELILKSER